MVSFSVIACSVTNGKYERKLDPSTENCTIAVQDSKCNLDIQIVILATTTQCTNGNVYLELIKTGHKQVGVAMADKTLKQDKQESLGV